MQLVCARRPDDPRAPIHLVVVDAPIETAVGLCQGLARLLCVRMPPGKDDRWLVEVANRCRPALLPGASARVMAADMDSVVDVLSGLRVTGWRIDGVKDQHVRARRPDDHPHIGDWAMSVGPVAVDDVLEAEALRLRVVHHGTSHDVETLAAERFRIMSPLEALELPRWLPGYLGALDETDGKVVLACQMAGVTRTTKNTARRDPIVAALIDGVRPWQA